jgi:amino acid transporter
MAPARGTLTKELGLRDVFAIATGATLSAGLFLLPGLAARQAGPAIVLCYLLAAVPLVPALFCIVELATAMPRAGGAYYFLERSLGPLVGTVGGLGTWLALVLKTSFALVGLGVYVSLYVEPEPWVVKSIAVGFALLFGTINVFGAKKTGGLQRKLVYGLLGILAAFVFVGLPRVEAARFEDFFAFGTESILATAGLVYISYVGVTKVASVAEEVRDPERNLPIGVFLSLGTAILVYVLCTTVMVGVVPLAELQESETAMATAASKLAGSTGQAVVAVAACLAFFSVANAGIMSSSRYPMAMSRDQLLPKGFASVSRFGTPLVSILLTVGVIVFIILALDPLRIAKLASAFQLMMFALLCLAVVVMRKSGLDSYDPSFRVPLFPWLPLFGIGAPFFLIYEMGPLPTLFSMGLVAAGVCWYMGYASKHVTRRGAIFHVFARLGEQRHDDLDVELRTILKEKGLRAADPFDEVVIGAIVLDLESALDFDTLVAHAAGALSMRMHPPGAGVHRRLHRGHAEGRHARGQGGRAAPHAPAEHRARAARARALQGGARVRHRRRVRQDQHRRAHPRRVLPRQQRERPRPALAHAGADCDPHRPGRLPHRAARRGERGASARGVPARRAPHLGAPRTGQRGGGADREDDPRPRAAGELSRRGDPARWTHARAARRHVPREDDRLLVIGEEAAIRTLYERFGS